MSDKRLFALITGGSSGIGFELAKVFAENGYNLILVARGTETLAKISSELQQQYHIHVDTLFYDLSDENNVFELCKEVDRLGIRVDVLVNNAGQGLYGKFVDTDIEDELNMIRLNVNAYVILTKHFLTKMVARNEGRILNVSSIAGKMPGPYQAVYHATKAFIHSFSEAIRAEVQDTDVTVTSLLPGATDTDFFHKAHMEESKMLEQKLSDPRKVAKDGFDALMRGEDMVIPGAKWKAQIAASNITPDATLAKMVMKQQEPSAKRH